MAPTTLLLKSAAVFSLIMALLTHAQTSGQPCGFKIAPCPETQVCVPNNSDCTDLNRCLGTCDYPTCGGFRANPQNCDSDSKCVDDARDGGCGQACDKPGICVPKQQRTCNVEADGSCPDGTTCFAWWTGGPVVGNDNDSYGICLLS